VIFWVTVKKKVSEKRLKRLDVKLEHHMTRPYTLHHDVSAFIYKY